MLCIILLILFLKLCQKEYLVLCLPHRKGIIVGNVYGCFHIELCLCFYKVCCTWRSLPWDPPPVFFTRCTLGFSDKINEAVSASTSWTFGHRLCWRTPLGTHQEFMVVPLTRSKLADGVTASVLAKRWVLTWYTWPITWIAATVTFHCASASERCQLFFCSTAVKIGELTACIRQPAVSQKTTIRLYAYGENDASPGHASDPQQQTTQLSFCWTVPVLILSDENFVQCSEKDCHISLFHYSRKWTPAIDKKLMENGSILLSGRTPKRRHKS